MSEMKEAALVDPSNLFGSPNCDEFIMIPPTLTDHLLFLLGRGVHTCDSKCFCVYVCLGGGGGEGFNRHAGSCLHFKRSGLKMSVRPCSVGKMELPKLVSDTRSITLSNRFTNMALL